MTEGPEDAPGVDFEPLFTDTVYRGPSRSEYIAGLSERSRRLRLVENDVTSLRTAVLMLCAAVAVLAYLVMREDHHAVS